MAAPEVLECTGGFNETCLCPRDHSYCWPRPDTRCCPALQYTDETPDDQVALIERMLRMSVEILHGMSGRQFGLCRRTIRPCRDDCRTIARPSWGWAANGGLLQPVLDGGEWFNAICGSCTGDCSCGNVCEVSLPALAQSIVQVRLDGLVLNPDMYRVDNRRKLVRLPLVRESTGAFAACVPPLANAVCVSTPSGDEMQVGGNDFDVSPDGQTFTLLTGVPFSVVFGRGRISPQVTMHLCAGAVVSWTNAVATAVSSDATLAAQSLSGFTVGAASANVTITFPSAVLPNDTMTPDFTIVGPPGCGTMTTGSMSYLVDGEACWPTCQDMSLPPTEPGTFEVTYLRGKPVPEYGLWAAGLLACELIKACGTTTEACECKLPSNVQSVVREGVSIDLEAFRLGGEGDPLFGRTGIPEVDLWLATVNPSRVPARSRAYSPDKRPPRRTTWPCTDD